MARSVTRPVPTSSSTTTTIEEASPHLPPPSPSSSSQTLVLRLSRPKKKVTWKEGTVDNEFLQRKSSKKCCIFHKQKPFDEDDSDGDEDDHGHRPDGPDPTSKKCSSGGDRCSGGEAASSGGDACCSSGSGEH
ncbi:type 1 phosphatases regulator ypi1-like protein [Cinnamomum micranthum f. kanehirae]|uniref:Type 1 phosphatases regulator ypi1-like protein n=1 Tax=Cinnamomum micranthum f. kanehirae TaxID=337451 RepID=A0A3S4PH03_9MAGN|nr:type 1 phosphatases regulator ypi1-like protein [Cinnamomum micranthum f. kanehirae]